MTKSHVLALCAIVLVGSHSAAAPPNDLLDAPLLAKNPKEPLVLLADQGWSAAEIRIQPREVTGTPKDLPRSSRRLSVGSFQSEKGRGPVTLVVDYAAYLQNRGDDAQGSVQIEIECTDIPDGCSYPIEKGVLPFRSAFMAKRDVASDAGKKVLVVGRESHSYSLPPNAQVRVNISLSDPKNLEPVQLRARLFYGEYDRKALPGQTTKSAMLWKIIGGALVVVLGAFWWLRRS